MQGDPKPARSDIERAIILIGKEIINLGSLFSCNFLPALLDRPPAEPSRRASCARHRARSLKCEKFRSRFCRIFFSIRDMHRPLNNYVPLANLYGDDDPPTYAEEIVEPKSFRNRLISVLIWTTCLPLVLLLFFQQKNFETASKLQDGLQLSLAREASLVIESNLSNIRSQLELALNSCRPDSTSEGIRRTFENVLEHNPGIRFLSVRIQPSQEALLFNNETFPQAASARPDPGELRLHLLPRDAERSSCRSLEARLSPAVLARDLDELLQGQSYAGAIFDGGRRLVYSTPNESMRRQAASEALSDDEIRSLNKALGSAFVLHTPGDRFASHIKAFVPIGATDWTLVVSQSQQVRDETMKDAALAWSIGIFVALAGTLILAALMSAPITRSFNALVESVEYYGKTGRFRRIDKQLKNAGSSEIVKLEETFARMVQAVNKSKTALQQINQRLEDEVRARTSDLLARNEELKTLQALLAPLSSHGNFQSSLIDSCTERFRVLLELPSLFFDTDIASGAPSQPNSVDVRLGKTLYGRLVLPAETLLTSDKKNSLERLAYALAIVTANARYVEHLSQEQASLQTVFESMTDGVVIIGRSGAIRYANEYAGKLLAEGETVLGLCFADLIASSWESTSGARISDDLDHRVKMRLRSQESEKNNRVLELLPFTVSDMPGLAGERTGWILRDITQEVSLEAVKENIVGVVAHELKTPLTLLQLQAQDLTRTIEQGLVPSAADVHALSDETLHLGQLVDDLLDVSRIRAGTMKLNQRVVHVDSLIDRAEKLAAARYPMRISRHIDMEAELCCVDPERLTQVFVNLFNNAARYKKPDQPQAIIDVSTRPQGQNIVIDVTDRGIGIAPGKAKRIFDQFYQADMSASRTYGGSGLGLTIVRGIIHAHGGTIAVHFSNPEQGTRFTIKLPLAAPPELL